MKKLIIFLSLFLFLPTVTLAQEEGDVNAAIEATADVVGQNKLISDIDKALEDVSPEDLSSMVQTVGSHNIGDFGNWATPNNRALLVGEVGEDLDNFQSAFQAALNDPKYVPIEARIGRAFIGGMSMIGEVLKRTLFDFVRIMLIVLLIFWIMMEAWHATKNAKDMKELGLEIVKKLVIVSAWMIVLSINPTKLFMYIMSPMLTFGTYLSDLIIGTVTTSLGTELPDTCKNIRDYMINNPIIIDPVTGQETGIMASDKVADLMCMPTRLSGFFYKSISIGLTWMSKGWGNSALVFFAGVIFVVVFTYNLWKFAITALGVIADLFLIIMLLPFTALAESFEKTNYDGPPGKIFEAFASMFQAEKLQKVFDKFLKATVYFVVLAIVAAVGLALFYGSLSNGEMPQPEADGFMKIAIVGALIWYIVSQADKWAEDIGGSVDRDISKQLQDSAGNAGKWLKGRYDGIKKMIKGK
jgi:hypothetical protein